MSRIILSIEIAHYLSQDDLISIARITNTPDLDDFKALCRVSNGDLFKYFSYKVRTKKTYVSYAINESIQGKTLFRYVPKPYKDQLWNEIINMTNNY